MLAFVLMMVIQTSVEVFGWAPAPPDTCVQCCCCVVTSAGTRNFYAQDGGGFDELTIPNCFFLQSHLDQVLQDWDGTGVGVGDDYTFQGTYVWWIPTDPNYGCFSDLATVTATNGASTTLPTNPATGVTGAPTLSPSPNTDSGGCIFEGGNNTGVICGNNSNSPLEVHSGARKPRLNYSVLFICVALAVTLITVNADTNVGGCIINGTDQSGITCDNNNNNPGETPTSSPTVKVQSAGIRQMNGGYVPWIVILCILFNIGLVVGDTNVGGCIIGGTDQQNVNCDNNTNDGSTTANHRLSAGEIVGIVLGSITLLVGLLAAGATILNPRTAVRNIPLWHYRRALVYKLLEGVTLGFGCGSLIGLETWAQHYVGAGDLWGWAARPHV